MASEPSKGCSVTGERHRRGAMSGAETAPSARFLANAEDVRLHQRRVADRELCRNAKHNAIAKNLPVPLSSIYSSCVGEHNGDQRATPKPNAGRKEACEDVTLLPGLHPAHRKGAERWPDEVTTNQLWNPLPSSETDRGSSVLPTRSRSLIAGTTRAG
jgi:hypothetical protein